MRISSNKVKDIVRFAHQELAENYIKGEVNTLIYALIEKFCHIGMVKALAEPELTVSESELLRVYFGIKDLKNNVPLQYVLGECDFLNTNILLSHKVLIPRPETEELVQRVIDENKAKPGLEIADLCCGSGCVAVALAKNLHGSSVVAIDIDPEAIAQTKENAEHNAVAVETLKADILNDVCIDRRFDIIFSNPPYVRESERSLMRANVIEHEPWQALFVSDENPLVFYRSIALFTQKYLKKDGVLYLETNEALCKETELIFTELGYQTKKLKDFRGKERGLIATKKG